MLLPSTSFHTASNTVVVRVHERAARFQCSLPLGVIKGMARHKNWAAREFRGAAPGKSRSWRSQALLFRSSLSDYYKWLSTSLPILNRSFPNVIDGAKVCLQQCFRNVLGRAQPAASMVLPSKESRSPQHYIIGRISWTVVLLLAVVLEAFCLLPYPSRFCMHPTPAGLSETTEKLCHHAGSVHFWAIVI